MTHSQYPIEEITVIPEVMEDQGYRIWYWLLDGIAFESPMEPFTPVYWKKNFNAVMVYGLSFPGHYEKDQGDLIILVTQDWKLVTENNPGVIFPMLHQIALFQLILEIEFPHTAGLKEMSVLALDEMLKKLVFTFEKFILPKRDEKGRYYRGFNPVDKYDIQPIDDQGRIKCPVCGKLVALGYDAMLFSGFQLDGNLVFMNGICRLCGEPFGVRLIPQLG